MPFFSDNTLVEDLIKKAKQEADVVVVHAHWGEENEDVLTETMTALSQMMVDWGADIIFGNKATGSCARSSSRTGILYPARKSARTCSAAWRS